MSITTPTSTEIREAVAKRLIVAIENDTKELQGAYKSRPLSAIAWIGRNLLELDIWTAYCLKSEENAKRFAEDCARDSLEMLNIPTDLFAKDGTFDFKAERQKLIAKALPTIPDIEEDFTRISDAAKSLDKVDGFRYHNKLFSKFAHPTALLVMSEMPEDITNGFKRIYYDGGMIFSNEALQMIADFLKEESSPS